MSTKKTLYVDVLNKVATYQKRCGTVVCGNSDYQIRFTFDSEWFDYDTKTARFIYNDMTTDIVFSGDTCAVPVVQNAELLEVGVFAGDLITTTPAIIPCLRSIRCSAGAPTDPTPDVYDQIMEQMNGMPQTGGGGSNGATFTPSVSSSGVISWTNDKGLTNPDPVNIKGPRGITGAAGTDGKDGSNGFSPTVEIVELDNGVRVTITDINGPKSFVIPYGSTDSGGGETDDPGSDDTIYYSVSTFATDALTNNTNLQVPAGGSYSATLTPTGDTLGAVTVRMSGVDVTSSSVMSEDGGATVQIDNVTGDIVITVGEEVVQDESPGEEYTWVKLLLANVSSSTAPCWIYNGDPFETTLTAIDGESHITFTITSNGEDVTSQWVVDDLGNTVVISVGTCSSLVITATA